MEEQEKRKISENEANRFYKMLKFIDLNSQIIQKKQKLIQELEEEIKYHKILEKNSRHFCILIKIKPQRVIFNLLLSE